VASEGILLNVTAASVHVVATLVLADEAKANSAAKILGVIAGSSFALAWASDLLGVT